MKRIKKQVLVCFALLWTSLAYAADISLVGVDYNIDTLQQLIVGPGCEYIQTHMARSSDGGSQLDVYFLRVDIRNPYIRLEQVLSNDKVVGNERPTAMMARKSTPTSVYVGGTNGDFYGTGGVPIGLTIGNSEYAYIGHPHYKIGTVREDGRPEIGNSNWWAADQQVTWVYTGKLVAGNDTFPIHHVNYTRYENELVLYNHYQGTSTGTNVYGSEAVLSLLPGEKWTTSGKMKAKVERVAANVGSTAITADKFVLSGHGTMKAVIESLQAGDEVEIIYSLIINGKETPVAQCISGHQTNLMVNNGVVVTENFWDELHPRTGYGYSQTGDTIIFCVVDGRNAPQSVGCNTQVLGAIMRHYGAWYALNWDGGGSSCMAINHFGQMNNPCDATGERAVANAMFVIADVPEDDQRVATLIPHESEFVVPRYGSYTPKFYAYNKYGILLDKELQDVTLSCDASLGEIYNGNEFVASGTQDGLLHATVDDATVDIHISFATDAEVAFRLDSVLLDNRKPYEMEVTSPIGENIVKLAPHVLTWISEDEHVCTVNEEGEIMAVNNGVTTVVGTLGSFEDTIQVRVQLPIERDYIWEDFVDNTDSWNIKASPTSFKPTFVAPTAERPFASLQFTGKTTRSPYILLEKDVPLYGLPDSIRIRFNTDAAVEKLTLTLRANNQATDEFKTHIFEPIPTNVDTTLSIAIGELFDATDPAIYPIWMKSLRFAISTKLTAGTYNIVWKGIELYYAGVAIGTSLEQASLPTWVVYPNPVADGVLQLSNLTVGSSLVLYDMQGRELLRQTIGGEQTQLDMHAYPVGQYLLTINNQTVKIIKK